MPVVDTKGDSDLTPLSSAAAVAWKCCIHSTAPLLGDSGARLSIVVIDTHSELRSTIFEVDSWRPPKEITRSDGTIGWEREGAIFLPAEIKSPGAVLVRKQDNQHGELSQDYIASIDLTCATSVHTITANSWVSSDHGWRVFFSGVAYLPKDTPPTLADERRDELRALQGTPETRLEKRKDTDRIYWYQVYSDLSSGKTGALVRPNLGDSKALPYPRRLATNRGDERDGREKAPQQGKDLWLPLDDQFSFDKSSDFNGAALQGSLAAAIATIAEAANASSRSPVTLLPTLVIGAARQVLGKILPGVESPLDNFEDFKDVIAMYKKSSGSFKSLLPTDLYPQGANGGAAADMDGKPSKVSPFKSADGGWEFQLNKEAAAKVDSYTAEMRVGPVYGSATGTPAARSFFAKDSKPGASKTDERLGSKLWNLVTGNTPTINNLLYFNPPRVLDGRPDAWHCDLEFGRQAVAGYNPCVITALTKLPESFGSAIRGEHINADLQGATLEQLVSEAAAGGKPRLYSIDYWDLSAFWEAAANEQIKDVVQHAGRAILYLRKDEQGNDAGLIPVAIELAHSKTHAKNPGLARTAGQVYSRSQLSADTATLAVWRLAKMIFKSLDSSFHQLISHWNRTHCVLEPFFIALRRHVSVMHPVYKLMLPHFRYTLNINRDARSGLINAGGIIEKSFSAGPYAMRLASVVYGKYWNFATEALPEDLKTRGMVDPTGKPWLDYPYATDGLDLWNALTSYFDTYLKLYYKSDEDVKGDTELQAWWHEVKTEGHPDLIRFGLRPGGETQLWGFEGPIPSVQQLVRVLVTIAWLASGHHAAVNFGQYDYTSFVLNASSLVRRPMPAPGDEGWEELTRARVGPTQEGILMMYLADPLTAITVAATVKLLSSHARDEHTLDEVNEQLVDPAAREANRAFIGAMKRLEETIEMRNADVANWARFGLATDDTAGPLPYTLLVPGSQAGVTMRGVPYSVSI